jgi:hypothetical protein
MNTKSPRTELDNRIYQGFATGGMQLKAGDRNALKNFASMYGITTVALKGSLKRLIEAERITYMDNYGSYWYATVEQVRRLNNR